MKKKKISVLQVQFALDPCGHTKEQRHLELAAGTKQFAVIMEPGPIKMETKYNSSAIRSKE